MMSHGGLGMAEESFLDKQQQGQKTGLICALGFLVIMMAMLLIGGAAIVILFLFSMVLMRSLIPPGFGLP